MRLPLFAAAAALCVSSLAAHADTLAISFTATGPTGISSETRGFEFSTAQTINVTGLGYYDYGADGLNASHPVAIWSATGTQLVSGVVAAGTIDPLNDSFRFTNALSGTTELGPGTYYIGGLSNLSDENVRALDASSVTVAPGITFLQNAYSSADTLSFPNQTQAGYNVGYFGANLEFTTPTVTPEPSSFLLLGTGLLGALGAARKRFT